MIKIIDVIGRVGLLCIFFVTVVGITLSYLNKGNSGFGRSFGGPEIMVIAIIAIPSIGLIMLARWLATNPRILMLDEPTRGIDVGAKADVYALIDELAKQGAAILLISSELPEILGLSDRVCVLVYSEFGRRVAENANLGTDHGSANTMFLAGKNVRGGHYGTAPKLTDLTDGGNLKYTVDFRQVYATAIKEWLQHDSTDQILKGSFSPLPIFSL